METNIRRKEKVKKTIKFAERIKKIQEEAEVVFVIFKNSKLISFLFFFYYLIFSYFSILIFLYFWFSKEDSITSYVTVTAIASNMTRHDSCYKSVTYNTVTVIILYNI